VSSTFNTSGKSNDKTKKISQSLHIRLKEEKDKRQNSAESMVRKFKDVRKSYEVYNKSLTNLKEWRQGGHRDIDEISTHRSLDYVWLYWREK